MASAPIINPSVMSDDEIMPRWPNMDPAKRCTAHKPDGSQCLRARKPGTTVCEAHGARAPQVKAAAERRVADAKAVELASRVHVELPQFHTPGDAARYMLSQVTRRAAQFGALSDQLQSAVYTDRAGQERVRAVLSEERRWLDSMSKLMAMASAAAAEPEGPDPVELFSMTVGLFREDVDSALCDVGIYGEQHEAIVARLAERAKLRVRQSEGMILEQIRIMTEARSG
jgi:hypothetical protein